MVVRKRRKPPDRKVQAGITQVGYGGRRSAWEDVEAAWPPTMLGDCNPLVETGRTALCLGRFDGEAVCAVHSESNLYGEMGTACEVWCGTDAPIWLMDALCRLTRGNVMATCEIMCATAIDFLTKSALCCMTRGDVTAECKALCGTAVALSSEGAQYCSHQWDVTEAYEDRCTRVAPLLLDTGGFDGSVRSTVRVGSGSIFGVRFVSLTSVWRDEKVLSTVWAIGDSIFAGSSESLDPGGRDSSV